MKNIKSMTVRFDLDAERDNKVWHYIHTSAKEIHKNCNNAVIEEIDEKYPYERAAQKSERSFVGYRKNGDP